MRKERVNADAEAAATAARQHGVVTVTQLMRAGLSAPAVSRRVAAGRLHRSGGRRKRSGLRIHRSLLAAHDVTVRSRIPVTTPARTIADLKRGVPAATVRKTKFRGVDLGDIETDHTRSELERAFLRLCRRHHLPEPEVNVRVAGFTVGLPVARAAPGCRD